MMMIFKKDKHFAHFEDLKPGSGHVIAIRDL